MDASGEDFAGTLHLQSDDMVQDSEVVYVDGTAYGRTPGGAWTVIPDYRTTQPINPFTKLEQGDWTYIGSEEGPTGMLHTLRTTDWIGDDVSTT